MSNGWPVQEREIHADRLPRQLANGATAEWAEQARESLAAIGATVLVVQAGDPVAGIPTCPNCSATTVRYITVANKAGNVATFGVFGVRKIFKNFECWTCRHTW